MVNYFTSKIKLSLWAKTVVVSFKSLPTSDSKIEPLSNSILPSKHKAVLYKSGVMVIFSFFGTKKIVTFSRILALTLNFLKKYELLKLFQQV